MGTPSKHTGAGQEASPQAGSVRGGRPAFARHSASDSTTGEEGLRTRGTQLPRVNTPTTPDKGPCATGGMVRGPLAPRALGTRPTVSTEHQLAYETSREMR